jgi:hypothetical protein
MPLETAHRSFQERGDAVLGKIRLSDIDPKSEKSRYFSRVNALVAIYSPNMLGPPPRQVGQKLRLPVGRHFLSKQRTWKRKKANPYQDQ